MREAPAGDDGGPRREVNLRRLCFCYALRMPVPPAFRRALAFALLAAALAGCTHVTPLRNAKTGQTAHCGGEMWTPFAGANDERCIKYFHQQGFDPVP